MKQQAEQEQQASEKQRFQEFAFNPDTEKAHELRQKFADLEAELMCDEAGTRAFTSSKSDSLPFRYTISHSRTSTSICTEYIMCVVCVCVCSMCII